MNRQIKTRVLAWLLTLVMVLGLTNGLTLPVQAAGEDSFEVTLNSTTGALEKIEYTLGSTSTATGHRTTNLILWDADDKTQRALVSDPVIDPSNGSKLVLQCGSNTVFGKRYRVASYIVSDAVDENTQNVPDDWPELSVTKLLESNSFSDPSKYTITIKDSAGTTIGTYNGYIGDVLKPHEFDYVANSYINSYDGQPHGIEIEISEGSFPFAGITPSSTLTPTIRYMDADGQYTLEDEDDIPKYPDAGEYEVGFQISYPSLGYKTVTGTRTVKINPIPVAISFESPVITKTLPLEGDNAKFTNPLNKTELPVGLEHDPIIYSSSNPEVATVNGEGEVTVLAAGTTTITATVQTTGNYAYDSTEVSYYLIVNKTDASVYFEKSLIEAYLDGESVESNPLKYSADGQDIETPDPNVVYRSSNEYVATVNSGTGKVTLVGQGREGSVTITATITDGPNYNNEPETVSYILLVSKKPVQVKLEQEGPFSGEFKDFESFQNNIQYKESGSETWISTGTTHPYVGDGRVLFKSSATEVATVSNQGQVTFKNAGFTTITAKFENSEKYKYIPSELSYDVEISKNALEVRFADSDPEPVSPDSSNMFQLDNNVTLETGQSISDAVAQSKNPLLYRNAGATNWNVETPSGVEVEFSSSNEDVATVNATTGQITRTGAGTTIITATFKENRVYSFAPNELSYTLTVEPYIFGIAYDPNSATKYLVDFLENPSFKPELKYTKDDGSTFEPTDETGDGIVTYTSSDESVATVDVDGVVTIKALGTTVITATVEDKGFYHYDPNVATFALTVEKKPCAIYYNDNQKNISKYPDETVSNPLRYLYLPDQYTDQPGDGAFTYTSSDESVATVDSTTGEVTITGIGTTVISVTVTDGDYFTYNPNEASYTLTVSKRKGVIVWDTTDFTGNGPYEKRVIFGGDDSLIIPAKKQSVEADGREGGDGIISYYTSDPKVATVDGSTGEVTIVGVGSTKVYATVSDTDVFTYASCGNQIEYTLVVEKGTLTPNTDYTAPTAKTDLEYNGSAQELVTPGKATGNHNHKFYYALGNASTAPTTGWSTSVSKATDAGTYYVWWKIIAESNYNNVPATMLTATISPKDVSVEGSNVTVSLADAGPFTYDGTSKAPGVVVKDGQRAISESSYTVTYRKKNGDNTWSNEKLTEAVDAGIYKAVAAFTGNYIGKRGSDVFEIVPANASASPAPKAKKNLVYNGEEQQLIEAGTPTFGTIKYAVTDSSETPTSFAEGTVKTDATAITKKDAGTYYVWWWIDEEGNYVGTAYNSLAVTIAPAATTVEIKDPTKVYRYTGGSLDPAGNYEVKSGAATLEGYNATYKRKNGSAWEDVAQVIGAGEYQIIFTKKDNNYAAPDPVTVTVEKAVSALTAPQAIKNLIYDGTAKALVSAGSAAGTGNKMLYAVNKSKTTAPTAWSEAIPTATDAGTYQVWYKSTGDKNHIETVCESPVEVTIAPKDASNLDITTEPATFVYNGRAQVPNSYLVKDGDKTVATYSVASYKKGSATIAVSEIKEVGTYTAVLTFAGNYSGTAEATFKITKAPVAVTVKPAAIENLVYNGNEQVLVTAGKCSNNESLKYAVTNEATAAAPETGWSADLPKATNAGKYYVWYKGIAADANHSDSEPAYIIVEIAPKDAFGDANITAKANPDRFEYTGIAQRPAIIVKDGESDISPVYYEISSYQRIDGSMWVTVTEENVVEVGTYKAIITLKGNYKGQREVAFVIEKKIAALATNPEPATDLTYNGQAQALLTSRGETKEGTLMFAAGDSNETAPVTGWSTAIPTGVDAGEYYIWYRIVGDENHKDCAAECLTTAAKINKATGEDCTVEAKPTKFMYDGTAKTPVITSVKVGDKELTESEYEVSYKKTVEEEEKDVLPKEVIDTGNYTLIVTPKNYSGVGTQPFKIIEAKPRFVGHSLVLTGSIGVNFYMELPDAPGFVYDRMEFTVGDGKPTTVAFDKNARSAEGYYRFTCYVNSIQMATNIKAKFYYSKNGEEQSPIEDTSGSSEGSGGYSVKKYVEDSMNMTFDDKTRALINAIAEYGYYAEAYLKEGSPEMQPVGSLTETDINKAKAAVASKAISIKRSSKVSKVSFSLFLDSDTKLRLYFTTVTSYKGTPTVTVDGKTWRARKETDGTRYYVDIPDIAANKLGTAYTVKFKTGTVTTTVTVSALSYAKAVFDQGHNPAEASDYAMTALYNYYKAAIAYKS